MIDSFFVKKTSRISALMMVMTLCLMVYNYAQQLLRDELRKSNDSVPNQKNRPTQMPTLKWIFQIMEGINIIRMEDDSSNIREIITNIDDIRRKIVQYMGKTAQLIYGFT